MSKSKIPKPPESWALEAQQLYLEYFQRRVQRTRTAYAHMLRLNHFLRMQVSQGLGFRDFPTSLLGAFFELHRDRNRHSALRCWLRFLYQRKVLLLPLHESLAPRPWKGRRRVPLSYSRILQVFALCPLDTPSGLRDRAYLELAYGTGMRRGELAGLDLGDVDLTEGSVFLKDTKNGRQRVVPLTRWARHFLQRYLQEARPQMSSPLSSNAFWLSPRGRRMCPCLVRTRLTKFYGAREKLDFRFTLHQLRHSCATHLLQGGADVRAVQELLNHVEASSTAIYLQITPDYLKEMYQRCHPRNRAPEGVKGLQVKEFQWPP